MEEKRHNDEGGTQTLGDVEGALGRNPTHPTFLDDIPGLRTL